MKSKTITSVSCLSGTLKLPADKSISHRAALFAALGEERSRIENFSQAADPQTTLQCLRQLAVSIQHPSDFLHSRQLSGEENHLHSTGDATTVIAGVGRHGFKTPKEALDCRNSGTTMRLLSGIVGGAGIKCTLTGDESLSNRTMKRIIGPLQKMGVEIEAREGDFAPLHIHRNEPLQAIDFELPIASAQLKSSVLLAGFFGEETTTVIENVPSRDHTERLLQLPVKFENNKKIISADSNCAIPSQSYRVPGDFSAAAYWLVAGAAHPEASIKLPAVGVNPTRTGALQILQKMGANISVENEQTEGFEPVADIHVKTSTLDPVDIGPDLVPNCIDELPVLMIAMLFANGKSTISGAEELRHKETDRLAAMAEVLRTADASFEEKQDGIIINGHPDFIPKAGEFNSYGDHRIAMAAAVLALRAEEPSKIIDADCTRISYPDFWKDLKAIKN